MIQVTVAAELVKISVKGSNLTTVNITADALAENKANSGAGIMIDEGAIGIIKNEFVAKKNHLHTHVEAK